MLCHWSSRRFCCHEFGRWKVLHASPQRARATYLTMGACVTYSTTIRGERCPRRKLRRQQEGKHVWRVAFFNLAISLVHWNLHETAQHRASEGSAFEPSSLVHCGISTILFATWTIGTCTLRKRCSTFNDSSSSLRLERIQVRFSATKGMSTTVPAINNFYASATLCMDPLRCTTDKLTTLSQRFTHGISLIFRNNLHRGIMHPPHNGILHHTVQRILKSQHRSTSQGMRECSPCQ